MLVVLNIVNVHFFKYELEPAQGKLINFKKNEFIVYWYILKP